MFQTIIVQPLYNLLVAIYGLIPGHDLGISLVIFTVIIRIALWPLLKKQLHQSKKMRDLQPELKKVKTAAAGDKQKEAALMMELYKEKGISPFGSIGLTIIQLPLFLGVFQAARDLTEGDYIAKMNTFTYSFVRDIPHITSIIKDNSLFNFVSLGFIHLNNRVMNNGVIDFAILAIGLAAIYLTYVQSKQILPQSKEKKKLRDILKASSQGKQPDQEDMTAAMGGSMLYLMPLLTGLFVFASQGAMIVYLLASSGIGIWQQSSIFKKDTDEMEDVAEVVSVKKQPLGPKDKPKQEAAKTELASEKVEKKSKKGKVTTTTRIITPAETSQNQRPKSSKSKKRRKRR